MSGTNPSSTTACASSRAAVPNRSQLSTSRAGSVAMRGSVGGRRLPPGCGHTRARDDAPVPARPRRHPDGLRTRDHGVGRRRVPRAGPAGARPRRCCARSSGRRSPAASWRTGCPPPRAAEAVRAYRAEFVTRMISDNAVFDGIPAVLDELRAAGVLLVVATSKPTVYAGRSATAFGLTATGRRDLRRAPRRHAVDEGRRRRRGARRVPRRLARPDGRRPRARRARRPRVRGRRPSA